MFHVKQSCQARSASSGFRSEEHTSELQSQSNLVCRLLLEKKTQWTAWRGDLWSSLLSRSSYCSPRDFEIAPSCRAGASSSVFVRPTGSAYFLAFSATITST